MTKIFVVTTGEYSEYRIEGVFTDSVAAELFRDFYQCDKVEVYDLNPEIPVVEGNMYWCCYYFKGQGGHDIRRLPNDSHPTGLKYNKYCLYQHIRANDEEHAIKIFDNSVRAFMAGQTVIYHVQTSSVACGKHNLNRTVFNHTQELMFQNGSIQVVHDDWKERANEAVEKYERGER